MNFYRIDLNLLLAFKALLATKSVTLAAEQFGITQPAMSNALSRLRNLLGDPLFVHTPEGMQPTPYALEIADSVSDGLRMLENAVRHRSVFDAASSSQVFRFHMTDMGQISFIPRLLERLESVAPGIRVEAETLPADAVREGLMTGQIHFAIGHLPRLNERGILCEPLLDARYAVMMRASHPAAKKPLTRKAFLATSHALVASVGGGHQIVEQTLARNRARIMARLPNILALPAILGCTNLVATLPERVAHELAQMGQFKVLPLPLHIPDFMVSMFWHERFHYDPALAWMRDQLCELFGRRKKEGAARSAKAPGRQTD
ncbi:MAG: LysR family transcriptional regulator [Noviherbaspirillum sp.]